MPSKNDFKAPYGNKYNRIGPNDSLDYHERGGGVKCARNKRHSGGGWSAKTKWPRVTFDETKGCVARKMVSVMMMPAGTHNVSMSQH